MESSGQNRIEVRRRGHLLGTTKVKCVLKGRNATGGLDSDADFIVLHEPATATFNPGDNQTCRLDYSVSAYHILIFSPLLQSVCIVLVSSDTRYEGLESLVLTLVLADDEPGVILTHNLDRAVIHITDHEDSKSQVV